MATGDGLYVTHKFLLQDARFSDSSREITIDRSTEDSANVQGLLFVPGYPAIASWDVHADAKESRVENRRSGCSLPVAVGMLSHDRLNPVWLEGESHTR
jgi:hypothetical protein